MILKNSTIKKDFDFVLKKIDFNFLKNKTIMITGASGFLGSLLTSLFLYANDTNKSNIKVLALSRHQELEYWFCDFENSDNIVHLKQDVSVPFETSEHVDYIIHTANPTQSRFLKEQPIDTLDIITNSIKNILEIAKANGAYVVNFSSMEAYGDFGGNRTVYADETMQGNLDLETMRNSYPISKRTAEFICNFYSQTQNVNVSSIRLAQTIGAGVKYEENKVYMMFLKCCRENKDIHLLSSGKSVSSKIYSADAITAVLTLMKHQANGIFNVANESATLSVKDMAKVAMRALQNSKIKLFIENNQEKSSIFLKDVKFKLNTAKLQALGWQPEFNLEQMFVRLNESFS